MWSITLGAINLTLFFIFEAILRPKRYYRIFLVAWMVLSIVLWCISAKFLSNEPPTAWNNVFLSSMPFICMFFLEGARRQHKKASTTDRNKNNNKEQKNT